MGQFPSLSCWGRKMADWDKWGLEANNRLWTYLNERADHQRYHPDSGGAAGEARPGPEGTARTRLLVAQKNAWAADMRALDEGHGVDVATQKAGWAYRMQLAEEAIDRRIAGENVYAEVPVTAHKARDAFAERKDLDL